MLLQVDVKSLIKSRVTVDQFLIASLIYEKNYDLLSTYLELYSSEELRIIFLGLIKTGLIENYNEDGKPYDFNKFTVKPSFIKVLAQGDFFDELVQLYPQIIIRPDGTKDWLRVDLNRCRKAYSKITENKYMIHQHIIECLQCELAIRRKEGKIGYMKRLPRWLASEEWKSYEERLDEFDDSFLTIGKEELGYGNQLE